MPAYGSLTLPSALYPGDSFNCINNEASSAYTSGTPGERVALSRNQDGSERQVSMEVSFSATPGTFEIDLQGADTDVSGAFQAESSGSITAATQFGGAGSFYGRVEVLVKANFVRPVFKTQCSNSVTINYVKITG